MVLDKCFGYAYDASEIRMCRDVCTVLCKAAWPRLELSAYFPTASASVICFPISSPS